jgi:hypothetical protein
LNLSKKEGRYGEFFPPEISRFGYNESAAQDDFPFTKEQAAAKDYNWDEIPRGTYGQEDAAKNIFACVQCKKNYRLIPAELQFYGQFAIPLPDLCPDCRHLRRINSRGPSKLWRRQCMCKNHAGQCPNEFETSFAPERTEILYCESCYNNEAVI